MIARKVVYSQLTKDKWVELIKVELEQPTDSESKEAKELLDELTQHLYKMDKLFLTTEHESVIIRGMEKKTFKIHFEV